MWNICCSVYIMIVTQVFVATCSCSWSLFLDCPFELIMTTIIAYEAWILIHVMDTTRHLHADMWVFQRKVRIRNVNMSMKNIYRITCGFILYSMFWGLGVIVFGAQWWQMLHSMYALRLPITTHNFIVSSMYLACIWECTRVLVSNTCWTHILDTGKCSCFLGNLIPLNFSIMYFPL